MTIDIGSEVKRDSWTNDLSRRISSLIHWMLALAFAGFMVSGCAMVGPDLEKPEPQILDDWMGAAGPWLSEGQTDYSDWWRVFNDPVLQELIEMAYRQNLSLQIAGIRIYEARAQLGIAVGNLYPQQQFSFGDLTTNKLSTSNEATLIDNRFNALSLGFDATWELDIWGKFRRSVQSGVANLAASVASFDDALVSLTAEVARTYIVMRTLEKRLEIAKENVDLQTSSLHIAEVRFTEGAVTELDVSQARSLLTDTQALIPRLESSLHQAQNALATLLGVLPGSLSDILVGPNEIPTASEAIIIDIPNNLLRRRPDIRISELQVAAQSPQIGIAKADLYPHFFLFGSIGWRSSDATTISSQNSLSDIFSYKSLFWSAGPGFSWDIFNYGRIKNRVRVEDARFQQLVVNYKNTVLNAQREVENALISYTRSKEEEQFLKDSVAASQRSVELSMIQYREGVIDYQRVLDSQRFLSNQSDRLTEVSGQVGTNLVATYKALGGGWQIRKGKEIISVDNKNDMLKRTSWGGLLNPQKIDHTVKGEERRAWYRPDW